MHGDNGPFIVRHWSPVSPVPNWMVS